MTRVCIAYIVERCRGFLKSFKLPPGWPVIILPAWVALMLLYYIGILMYLPGVGICYGSVLGMKGLIKVKDFFEKDE